MSYQVLARKWRPRDFSQVAGQEHVLRALTHALDRDRVHHAYLFTGTRGVGKTTLARILAKCLNCEQGVSAKPCGTCDACREIDEGRFVDLIEVDAASRTKVEDTRDLLENVPYSPTRGRYKVYLIDEVHMLSAHSFNALLKTLEEPPPHVKFLLATTDPQKVPVTILSRCLQFHLTRLPVARIAEYLASILKEEGVEAEPEALAEIARAADGSMRDALSLLDQAIAFCGGALQQEPVRELLGTVARDQLLAILEAVAAGDARAVLDNAQALADRTADFFGVLADLVSLLHEIARAQIDPALVGESTAQRERVLALAEALHPEDVQLYYQIALYGRRDLPLAPSPREGFEMALLRMLAFRPEQAEAAAPPARAAKPAATRPQARHAPKAAPAPAAAPVPAGQPDEAWEQLMHRLPLRGAARELAANCVLDEQGEGFIRLRLDPAAQHLCSRGVEERLRQALQAEFGENTRVTIEIGASERLTPAQWRAREAAERIQAAEQEIEQDEQVRALRSAFNAQVVPKSVVPKDRRGSGSAASEPTES